MKTKNQQLIAQLHEKRGEQKQFIVMYVICAVLALVCSIVFFCWKDLGAGFMCIGMLFLFANLAMTLKENYDYCEMLIDSLTLIDMLADRAGIDPDEPDDKEDVTKQNQNPGEKYVIYMDGILKYSTNSFDKCKEVFEDLCEHTDCNLMMYEWGKVIGSRGVRKLKK